MPRQEVFREAADCECGNPFFRGTLDYTLEDRCVNCQSLTSSYTTADHTSGRWQHYEGLVLTHIHTHRHTHTCIHTRHVLSPSFLISSVYDVWFFFVHDISVFEFASHDHHHHHYLLVRVVIIWSLFFTQCF